eukprot:TRINITY_DN851_c1_g1_i1.p1 TRINITY_DN851_c1_g1~~TRINITY_DN851_c1_g1_i1.p1  ORF type:complete len:362 (-),score=15.86 TRINITY_DN851_c1_g1_i1:34-1119(-)
MADWSINNSPPKAVAVPSAPFAVYSAVPVIVETKQQDDDALGILEDMPMRSLGVPTKAGSYTYPSEDVAEQDMECRNCHEPGGDDLIAPCPCTGSVKWVHRSCLDEWRAVSPNPLSFDHCDICRTPYEMEFVGEKEAGCPRLLFAFLLTRDFLIFALIVNAVATLCSVLVWAGDSHRQRDLLFDKIHWSGAPHLLIDWFYGWVAFFFVIGLMGIIFGLGTMCGLCCCSSSSRKSPTYDTYYYGSGWYFCFWPSPYYDYGDYGAHAHSCCGACYCGDGSCCGDCSCGHCSGGCGHCNCGGMDGSGLLLVLLVVVILIVCIGFIVGMVFMVMYGIKVVKAHIHILEYRFKAGQWRVKDLSHTA